MPRRGLGGDTSSMDAFLSTLRSHLGLRLALWLFVSVATIIAALFVPSLLDQERRLLRATLLELRGDLSANLATELSGETLAGLMERHPSLLGIVVLDADGKIAQASGQWPQIDVVSEAHEQQRSGLRGDRLEVFWPPETTGLDQAVAFNLDLTEITAPVRAEWPRMLLLVISSAVLVSLAVLMILSRLALGSLLSLQRRLVHALRRGNPVIDLKVPTDRHDELGEVEEAIGLLAERLAQAEARLETSVRDAQSEAVADLRLHCAQLEQELAALRQAEQELRHEAFHDRLTQLPNRELLLNRIEHALGRARRDRRLHFAFVVLNVDRFRLINDSLGQLGGDEVLTMLAERLRGLLRPGDTASRLSGNEFALLVEGIGDEAGAQPMLHRLVEVMGAPIMVETQEIFLTASVGVTFSRFGYLRADSVIQDAQSALDRARAEGRASICFYDPSMRAEKSDVLRMESELRRALEAGDQLSLAYQPVIDSMTNRVLGFEALMRWRHPDRGPISPGEFIPVAEDSGLIIAMGDWALGEATRQIAAWRQSHPEAEDFFVGVNVSARQLVEGNLVETVRSHLAAAEVPARALKLEVTESLLIRNPDLAVRILRALKALGIKLAIDDFGTGYSSLSYLRRFPFDMLKIDRSFVSAMREGPETREIVRTIIRLAQILGMEVIGEGVEEEEESLVLQSLGCRIVQGFAYGRPMPPKEAEAFLMASLEAEEPQEDSGAIVA